MINRGGLNAPPCVPLRAEIMAARKHFQALPAFEEDSSSQLGSDQSGSRQGSNAISVVSGIAEGPDQQSAASSLQGDWAQEGTAGTSSRPAREAQAQERMQHSPGAEGASHQAEAAQQPTALPDQAATAARSLSIKTHSKPDAAAPASGVSASRRSDPPAAAAPPGTEATASTDTDTPLAAVQRQTTDDAASGRASISSTPRFSSASGGVGLAMLLGNTPSPFDGPNSGVRAIGSRSGTVTPGTPLTPGQRIVTLANHAEEVRASKAGLAGLLGDTGLLGGPASRPPSMAAVARRLQDTAALREGGERLSPSLAKMPE